MFGLLGLIDYWVYCWRWWFPKKRRRPDVAEPYNHALHTSWDNYLEEGIKRCHRKKVWKKRFWKRHHT